MLELISRYGEKDLRPKWSGGKSGGWDRQGRGSIPAHAWRKRYVVKEAITREVFELGYCG